MLRLSKGDDPPVELKRPDPRVRVSWIVYALIVSLIPVILSVVLFQLPFIPRWIAGGFTGLWILILLVLLTVYIPLRYRHARYGINETELCVVSGVYVVNHHHMPLSSVRHVTVLQGPLERLFGYAFVWVSAAGGWLLLEGIPAAEAHELSRLLMQR